MLELQVLEIDLLTDNGTDNELMAGEYCTSDGKQCDSVNEPESLESIAEDFTDKKSPVTSSLFPKGTVYLYFPKPGDNIGSLSKRLRKQLKFRVSKNPPIAVKNALSLAGFSLVSKGDQWIGYWGKHWEIEKYKKVLPWQKVNHFPMAFQIGRKDKLYANHLIMKKKYGDQDFDFMPETYILPRDKKILDQRFAQFPKWILKPPASARGIGIKVISKLGDIPKKKSLVCSRYISPPCLINNRKFDLRVYVLVTSYDPLLIYRYQEGVVRFAAQTYDDSKKQNSRYTHLTNHSVSKKITKKLEEPIETKWSFAQLVSYFKSIDVEFDGIQKEIDSILIKTIMSVQSTNLDGMRGLVSNPKNFYELYGFDILLDNVYKPWLIEVNVSPSLKASCDTDRKIKQDLVSDLFNVVGISISDIESSRRQSFKRQSLTSADLSKRRKAMKGDTNILEQLSQHDFQILTRVEDENNRRGNFQRIWPNLDYSHHYKWLMAETYSDKLLNEWIKIENDANRVNLLRELLNRDVFQSNRKTKPSLSKLDQSSAQTLVNETPTIRNLVEKSQKSKVFRMKRNHV